jgi:hypothetical protein
MRQALVETQHADPAWAWQFGRSTNPVVEDRFEQDDNKRKLAGTWSRRSGGDTGDRKMLEDRRGDPLRVAERVEGTISAGHPLPAAVVRERQADDVVHGDVLTGERSVLAGAVAEHEGAASSAHEDVALLAARWQDAHDIGDLDAERRERPVIVGAEGEDATVRTDEEVVAPRSGSPPSRRRRPRGHRPVATTRGTGRRRRRTRRRPHRRASSRRHRRSARWQRCRPPPRGSSRGRRRSAHRLAPFPGNRCVGSIRYA